MSKKINTFVPSFTTQYNYKPIFESVNNDINPNLVAHEALSIRELLVRSSRGQRLEVHQRFRAEGIPDDMYPESELENVNETIHDTPPDGIHDIVDVMQYQEEIQQRKHALERKKDEERLRKQSQAPDKSKQEESPQAHNDEKRSAEE